MAKTRRQTLVAVLKGTNGYSIGELNAMNAVPGVQEFLRDAEARGISHTGLAGALVNFKRRGGSGLANAMRAIGESWVQADAPPVDPCADQKAALAQAETALQEALKAVQAAS